MVDKERILNDMIRERIERISILEQEVGTKLGSCQSSTATKKIVQCLHLRFVLFTVLFFESF